MSLLADSRHASGAVAMPAKLKSVKMVRVRCLGPGKEHTFQSPDPKTHRICKTCRDKIANLGMAMRDKPLPVRLEE